MSIIDFLSQFGPRLLAGTGVTVAQFLLAAALGIAISLCMGLMKLSPNRTIRWSAVTYIEVFRGTSLVVQLYWIFFVLPLFGITIEKFTAGYLAVGMNIGAYGAELVRGGILSVPKGQWEAALAINMSPAQRDHPSASAGQHAAALGQFDDRAFEGHRAGLADLGR